ncbi:smoothelin-like protein 1 isoform X2 [Erinaceus europaeus]|uniref:Smoothelin-like protein 1 isoform X2 n=1 Tax=Erinaceus europaeus TaxID=9365 RepID=A0A1S2ZHY5_ERIEU|nr:smoothelin-like protein 1 isoform X2 [Erinaceus europaeus]
MEQKEGQLCEDRATVSPTTEAPETSGGGGSTEKESKDGGRQSSIEVSPEGPAKQERAGNSLDTEGQALTHRPGEEDKEEKGDSPGPAQLHKEDARKGEPTVEAWEMTGETKSESTKAEGKDTTEASEKQEAQENKTKSKSKEKASKNEEAQAVTKEGDGKGKSMRACLEENAKTEETKAEAQEKDGVPEAKSVAQEEPAGEDQIKAKPQKEGSKEEAESAGTHEEAVTRESEEGAGGLPSSPEGWPESPTEEGFSPDGLSPEEMAGEETSPATSEPSAGCEEPPSPAEPPPEKKKERHPERRGVASARPRGPRAQNRKAIVDKFGGAASGPTALFRNPKAAGVAIGGVKSMLLEWCRAMTRNYEHVDIQNFSSSWSSGMAFCALIHKFFPDAFDYVALDPKQRRHNFTLAFSTAEKLADCAQLLEVDDMVRLSVPDSKCVYTYIQELYRCLVQKGLVKTKKK